MKLTAVILAIIIAANAPAFACPVDDQDPPVNDQDCADCDSVDPTPDPEPESPGWNGRTRD